MKNIEFPLFKTKIDGVNQKFDLTDVEQRKAYFQLKAGDEIKALQTYLKEGNTFIAYLLGKKNSGKGTYAKMFKEVVDQDRVEHLSIGDMMRALDDVVDDKKKRKQFLTDLEKNYRGFMPFKDIVKSLDQRRKTSTKALLPSELVLALVKMKINQAGLKKALFIDGFPRALDQVSYSLFFRDLIGYRDDPDVFVLIDVSETVIDERIKYRRVCPICQTSRNLKLLPTKKVVYNQAKKSFDLLCDNSQCSEEKLVSKEGDELGIKPIKERLQTDEKLIKQAFDLHGVPKVLLRNSAPVDKAGDLLDDYELTPEYFYQLKNGRVETGERPWQVKDDNNVLSYSLMPPPVVVSLIKQLVETLNI